MRRRRFRKPTLSLSLFPFLAVLVCTMGALIVLLVTVVQKARVDADLLASQTSEAQAAEETQAASLQQEKEIQDWRREVLEKQRDEIRAKLSSQRMELSHLEDHIRRLEEKWRQLQVQANQLQLLGDSTQHDADASREKLARVQEAIEAARVELDQIRRQAAQRKRTFAIIPYEGPNGTKRRPIYVECTDEGVVLQPEGLVLRPSDFEGSLGPGNPLDAALRTTREYLARRGDNKLYGEPYPLLVVRPNGTVAYAVARAAIKSWDDEFGYELIDADMELAYPQADPHLRQELERSVADARSRQAILATAMPGRFGRATTAGLVATNTGGFRAVGASAAAGRTTPSSASRGDGIGSGSSFSSVFQPERPAGDTMTSSSGGRSGATSGSAQTASSHSSGSSSGSGGTPGGSASTGSLNSMQAGTAGGTWSGSSTTTGLQMPGNGDQSSPNARTASSSSNRSSSHASGKPNTGSAKNVTPLAASRGANWGLPNGGAAATGFTRHISVQCMRNQLVILPESGDHQSPTVIPAEADLAPAMDPFVSAIWKRMDSWGIAAENGYWRPVLKVAVEPSSEAEARFDEFVTLLDGSGLVVERR